MLKGSRFTQTPPGRHRANGWDDYRIFPQAREYTFDAVGTWARLDGDDDVEIEGRLVSGCIETLCNVAGTPYGDVAAFLRTEAPEGLLMYVEASCMSKQGGRRFHDPPQPPRDEAGPLLRRCERGPRRRASAPGKDSLTQHEAVLDSLGPLGVPVIADVECGHVPPYLPIVNGAHDCVACTSTRHELPQTLD
jgi:muramoyltetrapeptide carboxypeptidase LdcA involved in peptidoglycan recycling